MLDAYSRRARLAPAALAAMPAAVLLASAAIAPRQLASMTAIVVASISIVVCGVVRDRGRHLQADLWASWGGSPTVQRLRWADAADRGALERLHRRLESVLQHPLPTADEEAAGPSEADRRYEEAVAVLRELTRDRTRFPLVFEENAEYGFRRNALGVRGAAIGIATGTLVVSGLLLGLAEGSASERLARFAPTAAIAAFAAIAWWWLVGAEWVRRSADLYADRLLEAVGALERDAAGGTHIDDHVADR